MFSKAKAVVIGGGVVGVSTLYHLASKGWDDVILLERKSLTSGSTWHAAGLLPLFNMSYSVGQIHKYSVKFYQELQNETGMNVGFKKVSNIRLASKLVCWNLNIISNEEAEAKVKVDETEFLAKIIDSIGVTEEIAEKIISIGLSTFDEIAYASDETFKEFIDSDEEIKRVKSASEDAALMEAMGVITEEEDNVESLTDLNLDDENIQKLSNKGIKNKDDLAELSIDELQDIIEISEDDASKMIMKAREHWFN